MKSSVSQDVAQYSMQESVSKKLIAQKESRQKKGRSLSNHVGSRWYRAPEVSLCETQYDIASDMWGIGCIIFEPDNKKYQDRVIFPGSSCFPLSPCEKTRKTLDS
jgi:serine/threonine protein kinase